MPTPTLSPQSRTGLLTLLSFVLSAAPAFAQYPIAVESPVSSEGRAAATGLQEAFVGAYSVADGSYQWGFILAPSTSPSNRIATGQTVGTDGTTVYVAGTFRETIDLDPSDDYNGQSSEGGLDVFLAAYNAATGSYQWSASLGGSGEDLVRDIALGGGTVSMAGSFEETVDFSNGTLIDARPSAGGYDAYVSAYDRTTGLSLGAYTLGDTDEDEAYGVAADGTTLYATGYFEGTVAFPTAGGTTTLTSAGDTRDAFVAEVAFSAPVDTSPAGWPVTFGSKDGMDQVEGLAAAGGRVFTTGTFAGLTDFDSGPGMYVLSPMGGENAFVAAYDEADASLLWAFQLGGEDQTEGNSIATDGTNVYVTGAFNGTVDFDPGPDEFLLTSQETWDNSFVAAYDAASGAFVWAIKLAPENDITVGNPDFVDVNAITTDGTNVYLTGTFRGPADFDPGPGTTSLTGQSGDIFLAAYSAGAGAFVWVTAPSGPEYDDGRNLATDGTRVYASGGFRSTVNFDPSGSAPLTATGNQDGFVAAYDAADGSYLWAFAVGGAGVFTSNDALALSNDRLFIGGDFDGTVQFDPDEIAAPLTATNDLYVAAYTTDGAYLWAELLNSNGSQRVNALTADAFNVYATGWFDGTLDLDPGPGTANVNNIGYDDLFLGIYGADTGAYKDGYQAGSSQDDYGTTGNALAIAGSSLYVGGYFSFTVDLALDDAVANRTSSGGANEDAFVTRLSVNNTPLPVELTSFEASVDGDDQVFLTWATASETNNAGFEVQTRSLDAEPQPWETLAFVEGHGTSAQAHTYEHRVHNLEPGPHRFRLKQIDFDGTFTYSPEVEVALRVPGTHRLSAPYPNPSSDRVRFALTVAHAQHVSIAVYDALGRRVAMLHDGSVEANQRLHVEWQPDALPGGLYFVRAQGDRFAETGRVVLNP